MLVLGERELPHPRHALTAHLREGGGAPVHPHRHVVAADARHGAGALGHARAGVVWAAATKPRSALAGVGLELGHGAFAGFNDGKARVHAGHDVCRDTELLQPLGNRLGDEGGREVGLGTQQPVLAGVGHGPLATRDVAFRFVELAQHMRAHIGTPVVQLFFQLVFDDLAFLFHHQDLLQPLGKTARDGGFERPHHVDLVHPNSQLAASVVIEPQVHQRLARVVVGLAAGDDAEAVVLALDHVVVELVGAHVGQGRVPLVVHQARLLLQRRVGPADVQAARRHDKVLGHHDLHAVGVEAHTAGRLHHLLDGLHARPHA